MADRVHPSEDSPLVAAAEAEAEAATMSAGPAGETPFKPTHPSPGRPVAPPAPPAGTYIIQVPKDQIYRYPPPENAKKYQRLTSQKPRRSCCGRCLCWSLCLLLLLIVAAAVAAGVLYLVFRPKAPKYTINDVAFRGLNLTSASPLSPEIDVTVQADNTNDKIGIYYCDGSSVKVYYSDEELCNGVWPVFYQPSNNLTLFHTALKASGEVLSSAVKSGLLNAQRQQKIPLSLKLKVPVKFKVGAVKTWKITVKVRCDLTVDRLTADSKILSKDCHYSVKLW